MVNLKRKPVSERTRLRRILAFNIIALISIVCAMYYTNLYFSEISSELSFRAYFNGETKYKINFTGSNETAVTINPSYTKLAGVELTGINITYIIILCTMLTCAINNIFDMTALMYKYKNDRVIMDNLNLKNPNK